MSSSQAFVYISELLKDNGEVSNLSELNIAFFIVWTSNSLAFMYFMYLS